MERPIRLISVVFTGALVGLAVAGAAMVLGGGSCAGETVAPLPATVPCRDLVVSLALRAGAVAGVATVWIYYMTRGLYRTAVRMEEDRRAREREPS